MDEQILIAMAAKAVGEPRGEAPQSADLGEFERAIAVLRKATLQADPARVAALESRLARRPAASLWMIAASLVLSLGLVAAFAALNSGVAPAAPESRAHPQAPRDWLNEQIAEATAAETGATFNKSDLRGPAPGAPGEDLLKAVASQVDFKPVLPKNLPKGFALADAKVFRAKATGLEFDVLRLTYTKGEATLVLLEAENGFPWRSEFVSRAGTHAVSATCNGTAVLVISNAFSSEALQAIAHALEDQ